jgi:molybdate transport system ATP-binding protein
VPAVGGKIVYRFTSNGTSQQDRIAYVAFDSQIEDTGCAGLYHQARWNSGVDHGALSVSDYLSAQRVNGLNPYEVVGGRADPPAFRAYREKVVEFLGIGPLLGRSLSQVSNGERRKVTLARGLLKRPSLLVLDNPFTGLDTDFRARLRALLGGSMLGNMTVVLATAGFEEVPPGITHVLILDRGKVVARGPAEAMLDEVSPAELQPRVGAWTGVPAGREPAPGRPAAGDKGTGRVLVRMRGVGVAYGGHQLLRGIDWTVRRGEHWALLGPNGAGKTTLLSLILGDNPQAYANDVELFGRRRGSGESIWEIKRRIGWVAPELHLYYPGHVSCLDVVSSGFFASVGCHRRPSRQQRDAARAWMARLGVSHHADLAFGEISEGEQRLVLIARALVADPELLVLDEPCQGLDAGHRGRVLQAVNTVGHRRDTTIIYVTHDPLALPATVSHVLRLDAGRIVGQGRLPGCAGDKDYRRICFGERWSEDAEQSYDL